MVPLIAQLALPLNTQEFRNGLKLTVVIDVSDPVVCTAFCLDWHWPPSEEIFHNRKRG